MINPHSHREAKEFFIQKVISQAEKENIQLSRAEKYMLQWSEKDPSFHMDQTLIEEFEKEISAAEYEKKISKQIIQAYDKDIEVNSTAKEKYRQAYKALKTHDTYLFIMVDKAIGRHFNKIGLFFGSYPVGREFILHAIFFAVLFLFAMSYVVCTLSEQPITAERMKAISPALFKALILGAVSFYYMNKYIRHKKDKF